MGTYCTYTGYQAKMIGTDFDNDVTLDLAEACQEDAEAEINKYIAGLYDTSGSPFNTSTSIPPIIRTICEWFSMGYMYEGNALGGKDSYNRADRYLDRARKNLEKITSGDLKLTDTTGSIIPERDNGYYEIHDSSSEYYNTFNEDDPLKWSVDPDKLEDIANERS